MFDATAELKAALRVNVIGRDQSEPACDMRTGANRLQAAEPEFGQSFLQCIRTSRFYTPLRWRAYFLLDIVFQLL